MKGPSIAVVGIGLHGLSRGLFVNKDPAPVGVAPRQRLPTVPVTQELAAITSFRGLSPGASD